MLKLNGTPNFDQGEPATTGATRWEIGKSRLKYQVGLFLNTLRVPGLIKPLKVYDCLTNTNIEIRLGGYYSTITVNGKDFYFDRFSGKYDGSGMGICKPYIKKEAEKSNQQEVG